MKTKDEIAAHSKTLKITIAEVMRFLGDDAKRPKGVRLRSFLHEKLADLSEHWYRRGLRRGHLEIYKDWKRTEEVSKTFRYAGVREFFDGQEREIHVRSKIHRKK